MNLKVRHGAWDFVKLVSFSKGADIRRRHQQRELWERSSSTTATMQTQWHTGWHQLSEHIVLKRGANRPLDTNQTPTEACENVCNTLGSHSHQQSSHTSGEKKDAKIDTQQMPKLTMARQYDKVSTQVHVNSAPFLTMYKGGGKQQVLQKNSIH